MQMGKTRGCAVYSIFLLWMTLQLYCVTSSPSQSQNNQGIDVADSRNLREEQPEVHCSRERSRAAWKIIEEYLMPFVEKQKYQLSSQCRLHPSNDIFRDQETHKSHVDINEWRCGYCKKIFRAEKYLDQHFDNRHYNLLNVKRTSVFYLAISVLVLMFLPLFYLIVYLYQREMKTQTTQLKRISKQGRKPKPS
ncbi:UNVERIFIED_CONTAM: hypothetical protein Sradi_3964300 [Sesamum radiatum]|uniref:C2H2-type domain-containing protein n=1 Tax=Sesamum radiatum TaxID=300843 RepID=A0AAW2PG70_SESRA